MAARPLGQPEQARRRASRTGRPGRRRAGLSAGLAIAETLAQPTRATPNGSATSRSATTGSATCGAPRATWTAPRRPTSRPRDRANAWRRRPGQRRMAARPVDQPRKDRRRAGGGRPGGGADHLPGHPAIPCGWPTPTRQHRMAAGPLRHPQQARGRAGAAGHLAAARDHYQAALEIRVRLADADPANTEWQHDLSVCHNRIGDVRSPQGTSRRPRPLSGRPRHHRAAGRRRPGNAGWQRDLSVSHEKMGDVAADGRGIWRGAATTTRLAWTSLSGWPPPTRPTRRLAA